MIWDDAMIATLRRRLDEGWSAGQVANEIGRGLTRNAVIGKAHRLKLGMKAKRRPAPLAPRNPQPRPARAALSGKLQPLMVASMAFDRLAPVTRDPSEKFQPLMVDFMAIGPAQCRWPYGNPKDLSDFRFCGCPTSPEESYCHHHRAIGEETISQRRAAGETKKIAHAG